MYLNNDLEFFLLNKYMIWAVLVFAICILCFARIQLITGNCLNRNTYSISKIKKFFFVSKEINITVLLHNIGL